MRKPMNDRMYEKIKKILGKNIKDNRLRHAFTVEDFAEFTDLSTSFISHMERGTRSPGLKSLLKIAETFNLTIDDLLEENDDDLFGSDNETVNYSMSTEKLSVGNSSSSINVAESKRFINDKKAIINVLLQGLNEAEHDILISIIKNMLSAKHINTHFQKLSVDDIDYLMEGNDD